jgi:hypothetical protein
MINKTITVLAIVSVLIGGTILPAYATAIVVLEVRPVINTNSNGVIPMLLVGDTGFDVTNVDVRSLEFGPDGAAPVNLKAHLVDVNGDGFKDLLTHYRVQETGIAFGDTEACLTGETLDGTPFEGCGTIRTVQK